jgi:hypothetical protein
MRRGAVLRGVEITTRSRQFDLAKSSHYSYLELF